MNEPRLLDDYWRLILHRHLDQLATATSGRLDALHAAAFRMGQLVAVDAPTEPIPRYLMEGPCLERHRPAPLPGRHGLPERLPGL
jgi:hypothetical protein